VKRLLLYLLMAAGTLAAQALKDADVPIQKLVTLKYVEPNTVQRLLAHFGVDIQWDVRSKVIAISGPRNRVSTAEDAIKQLDVPDAAQKDIELTVYFVVGSDQPNLSGNPLPPDLQTTVAALKGTFPFKSYALMDVLSLQTRSGVGAETTGHLAGSRFTTFRVGSASIDGNGSMIRLDRLHAGVRIPVTSTTGRAGATGGQATQTYIDTGISTDVVDVKEGQKLVVGRSSLDGPEKALILVLIAKIIN